MTGTYIVGGTQSVQVEQNSGFEGHGSCLSIAVTEQ